MPGCLTEFYRRRTDSGKAGQAEELDALGSVVSDASVMASCLANTCGILGEIVAEDEDDRGGWFGNKHDLAYLLFGIQSQVQTIHALIDLGDLAMSLARSKRGHYKDVPATADKVKKP